METNVKKEYAENAELELRVLRKTIRKSGQIYRFYDFDFCGIIVLGCKINKGQNGYFISTPSEFRDGKYYHHVYINDDISRSVLEWLQGVDWTDTNGTIFDTNKKSDTPADDSPF